MVHILAYAWSSSFLQVPWYWLYLQGVVHLSQSHHTVVTHIHIGALSVLRAVEVRKPVRCVESIQCEDQLSQKRVV